MVAQELQVAAADHRGPALDETNHGVAQRRGFPWIGGDTLFAIKGSGDVTVAGAVPAAIGGPHHQAQAPSLRNCHSRVRWYRPLVIATPETDERFDSPERLGIQRDQGRELPVFFAAGKEEKLCGDHTVMDGMESLRTLAMRTEPAGRRVRFE